MTVAAPTAQEIQQAKAYLAGTNLPISPRRLAGAAKELGKSLADTIRYLNLLLAGGSGDQPAPIATAGEDRTDPQRALGDMTPSQTMEYDGAAPP